MEYVQLKFYLTVFDLWEYFSKCFCYIQTHWSCWIQFRSTETNHNQMCMSLCPQWFLALKDFFFFFGNTPMKSMKFLTNTYNNGWILNVLEFWYTIGSLHSQGKHFKITWNKSFIQTNLGIHIQPHMHNWKQHCTRLDLIYPNAYFQIL